jgi:crossover junction endonuclease MUS81
MDYIITFDNREKEIIKKLNEKGYDVLCENLDIGDIQFLDLKTKEVVIVIERKTLSDLSASIKDGRYKEQKNRMIHSLHESVRKIVLLEGTNLEDFSLSIGTLNSVIINTMIRDNIHIYWSKSYDDTIEFIENIILQLAKYYENLKKEIVYHEKKEANHDFSISVKKKENITPMICFRNMLCQIPGISLKISEILCNKYQNMNHFLETMKELTNNNQEEIIKMIGNEKYGTNNKRIGDKTAEKIYTFLFTNENIMKSNDTKKLVNKKKKNNPFYDNFNVNISLFSE